jgi:hypothetical protein
MNRASRSILVFGIYLVATALLLVSTPNTLLGVLRVAPTTEPWIRILGIVVGVLGGYYIAAARAELTPFFRATVWGRSVVLAALCFLAVLKLAPPILIGFGIIDALGALWTWSALRSPAVAGAA